MEHIRRTGQKGQNRRTDARKKKQERQKAKWAKVGARHRLEAAVVRLNKSLDRNKGHYGLKDRNAISKSIDWLDQLTRHSIPDEKPVGLDISGLVSICTDPNFDSIMRMQTINILKRCPASLVTSVLVDLVISPEVQQQQRTLAAVSLIRLGTDDSITQLPNIVNHLSDEQKVTCVQELKKVRTPTGERVLKLLQQMGAGTRRVSRPPAHNLGPRKLEWTVLPIGWWGDPKYMQLISRSKNRQTVELMTDRLRFLDNLRPKERYIGQERFGSDPYWVFVFEKHVVAECPMEGNAVYVISGTHDWTILLNQSKGDLRQNNPERFRKIVHQGEWKLRLLEALEGSVDAP